MCIRDSSRGDLPVREDRQVRREESQVEVRLRDGLDAMCERRDAVLACFLIFTDISSRLWSIILPASRSVLSRTTPHGLSIIALFPKPVSQIFASAIHCGLMELLCVL